MVQGRLQSTFGNACFPPRAVESRCGAVALGRTYPLPPLSSGGALVVPPSLRFHIPLIGRVEDWRAGLGRSLGSLLSRPFVCECPTISTMPRLQLVNRRWIGTPYWSGPLGAD